MYDISESVFPEFSLIIHNGDDRLHTCSNDDDIEIFSTGIFRHDTYHRWKVGRVNGT